MTDYMDWTSELDARQVLEQGEPMSHPTFVGDKHILFNGVLKAEKSRSVLKRLCLSTGEVGTITPAPYHLQTRVNEYGGRAYWVFADHLVFANRSDQCLYRQTLIGEDQEIEKISPDASEMKMYADVHHLGQARYMTIVETENAQDHSQNLMSIAAFDSDSGAYWELVQGADFYSNLVLSEDASNLAWVEWDHPNMPWDTTRLKLASLHKEGDSVALAEPKEIDLSAICSGSASVCQLCFVGSHTLVFSVDFAGQEPHGDNVDSPSFNYWNVYALNLASGEITPLTQGDREYGYPHWVYGDTRIVSMGDNKIVTVASRVDGDDLVLIDLRNTSNTEIWQSSGAIQHLARLNSEKLTFVHCPSDRAPELVTFDLQRGELSREIKVRTPDYAVSSPEHISVHVADERCHAFFYAPANSAWLDKTDAERKPPLLVMVHGGPTARAYAYFDAQKQYWTSRGFAVVDINHRGSSGYGRAYRDRLYGEWGVVDAQDIAAVIADLVERGWVDPNRICIRGKSAGGYAVLRALTEYPKLFKAGACYYGIGNLATLAASTHKFEKHYVDRLLAEDYVPGIEKDQSSNYYRRSPINFMSQLESSMIVLQGSLDKVVPPELSREVVQLLEKMKLFHEYVEYPDEAHGFKQIDNNVDAWTKELAFYKHAFNAH